jgi:hypothetical protein
VNVGKGTGPLTFKKILKMEQHIEEINEQLSQNMRRNRMNLMLAWLQKHYYTTPRPPEYDDILEEYFDLRAESTETRG